MKQDKAIKINERWSILRDPYCWELQEHYTGLNRKTGQMVPCVNKTWYGNLRQIADKITEVCAKEADSMEELKELLESAQESVEEFVKGKIK